VPVGDALDVPSRVPAGRTLRGEMTVRGSLLLLPAVQILLSARADPVSGGAVISRRPRLPPP
jgi:hypothetical protein